MWVSLCSRVVSSLCCLVLCMCLVWWLVVLLLVRLVRYLWFSVMCCGLWVWFMLLVGRLLCYLILILWFRCLWKVGGNLFVVLFKSCWLVLCCVGFSLGVLSFRCRVVVVLLVL